MKDGIKKWVFRLLDKPYSQLTKDEELYLKQVLTYELINEWMDLTGKAVLISGITSEPEQRNIKDLLNLTKEYGKN